MASKTGFLILLITLCVCGQTSAQRYYDDDYRTFYGGLIAGTNFTQVDGDNFAGYHKVGFNVGGVVYSRIDEHMVYYRLWHNAELC
jgi:hypothetical protein